MHPREGSFQLARQADSHLRLKQADTDLMNTGEFGDTSLGAENGSQAVQPVIPTTASQYSSLGVSVFFPAEKGTFL